MPDTQMVRVAREAFKKYRPVDRVVCQDFGMQHDDILDQQLEAALQAALSGHVVGWRTMDSAPKDGTDIVLAAIDQVFRGEPMPDRVTVGHWTTDDECREVIGDCGGECRCPEYKFHEPSWISWDGGFTEENPPTHWQPLPAPPVPEMEG